MKIFISYSFRPENDWVEKYVCPIIETFGHEPVTGRILDTGGLDDEVKRKIRQCRRVLCFATRATPRYGQGGEIVSYDPPDWVRDELMMARGGDREALEFRERGVSYGGASILRPYVDFDRDQLPQMLLDLALRVSEWPVGPLQLRLTIPEEFQAEVESAANADTLRARCVAIDLDGTERSSEQLRVHTREGQLIVPFWIKPDPNLSIEIEVDLGARRLAARGISPAVHPARLRLVGT